MKKLGYCMDEKSHKTGWFEEYDNWSIRLSGCFAKKLLTYAQLLHQRLYPARNK